MVVSGSESYVITGGQSASLSWNKAPIWGLQPDIYYCLTVVGLFMWGFLSDERTGLSFAIAVGHRQRSHSRVRVPWDLRPYFTVSDSRLSFSSPPTTSKDMMEVFDPISTRVSWICQSQSQSQSHVTTDGQSASLSWWQTPTWGLRPWLCLANSFCSVCFLRSR
jgi:hypothetical protein